MNAIEEVATVILLLLVAIWALNALRGNGMAWLQSKFLIADSGSTTSTTSTTSATAAPGTAGGVASTNPGAQASAPYIA